MRPPKPHKQQKQLINVLIAVAVVLVITLFYFASPLGKTIEQCVPELDRDLINKPSFAFTLSCLPQDGLSTLTFTSALNPDDSGTDLSIELSKFDNQNYQFSIKQGTTTLATDLLQTTSLNDSSLLYLGQADPLPDLEVQFQPPQTIRITNKNYVDQKTAIISLLDAHGAALPKVNRVPAGSFSASIKASNTRAVPSSIYVGDVEQEGSTANEAEKFRTVPWTTTLSDNAATTFAINASVLGKHTTAYYTFVTGSVLYASAADATSFPELKIESTTTDIERVTVALRPTSELQPFAIPCATTLPVESTVLSLTNLDKIYSYENTEVKYWIPGPNNKKDFTHFEPFKGYFIQLRDTAPAPLVINCDVKAVSPNVPIPNHITFASGWSLFSLPGVQSQAMSTYTAGNYKIFQCAQNYRCTEVTDGILEPGKPYWFYNLQTAISMGYRLE